MKTYFPDDVLAIFAKYPRLGTVKTRMEGALDKNGCLRLHRALLADTLKRTAVLDCNRRLFLADGVPGRLARISHGVSKRNGSKPCECKASEGSTPGCSVRIECQRGADLGGRLADAWRRLAKVGRRVVFIGVDSPDLPLGFLRRAFDELSRRPVVIGPTADGGYYLIGFSEARPGVFEGIDWGTSRVLVQTLNRLPPRERFLLPSWYDVDRFEDLVALQQRLRVHPSQPGFPRHTARLLEGILG